MTYHETVWLEKNMTTQQKVDGLNNLETIYGELHTIITTHNHDSRYYSEAQCDEKYFSSSTDGHGSGLVAETVDGLTAEQIINLGAPSGCIADWPRSAGEIPDGWVACDGLNGTPPLTGRMVIGAGGEYSVGDMGGSDVVTANATVTVAGHALTAEEMPLHEHSGIVDYYATGESIYCSWAASGYTKAYSSTSRTAYTEYAGSGSEHSHSGSTWSPTVDQILMPPYVVTIKIMKV